MSSHTAPTTPSDHGGSLNAPVLGIKKGILDNVGVRIGLSEAGTMNAHARLQTARQSSLARLSPLTVMSGRSVWTTSIKSLCCAIILVTSLYAPGASSTKPSDGFV
jgi:hypothetical protein